MSIRIKPKGSEYGYFDVTDVQGLHDGQLPKEGKLSFVNTSKNGNRTKVTLDVSEIAAYEETLEEETV